MQHTLSRWSDSLNKYQLRDPEVITPPLDPAGAFQIVLDLAKLNVVSEKDEPVLNARQREAINIIEDIAVNQYGDS